MSSLLLILHSEVLPAGARVKVLRPILDACVVVVLNFLYYLIYLTLPSFLLEQFLVPLNYLLSRFFTRLQHQRQFLLKILQIVSHHHLLVNTVFIELILINTLVFVEDLLVFWTLISVVVKTQSDTIDLLSGQLWHHTKLCITNNTSLTLPRSDLFWRKCCGRWLVL